MGQDESRERLFDIKCYRKQCGGIHAMYIDERQKKKNYKEEEEEEKWLQIMCEYGKGNSGR